MLYGMFLYFLLTWENETSLKEHSAGINYHQGDAVEGGMLRMIQLNRNKV